MSAEECRWETHEETTRERERVKRKKKKCKKYPWYDPRGWVCKVVTFFETVWVEVKNEVREWVCTAVEVVEEVLVYIERVINWIASVVDHLVGVYLLNNPTGYWPILESASSRAVASRARLSSSTRSIVWNLPRAIPPATSPYDSNGVHLDVEIRDEIVQVRESGGDWQPLLVRERDLPHFRDRVPELRDNRLLGAPLAVSYDDERLGHWFRAPEFDLVVAQGDRLLAKVAGKDDIYMLILGHPYVHNPENHGPIRLPQNFFKLDPRCGVATTDRTQLVAHVEVANDDEKHLATERFPVCRAMWLAEDFYLDLMYTRFTPRVWHKVDARPRKDSVDPPGRYPRYDHVTYERNLISLDTLSRRQPRRSIKFLRVLDLGIGASHLHEQHDARFGGEMDSLSGSGGIIGDRLKLVRQALFGGVKFDAAYRFANGPIEDYGGWVDGTCIYYMLVQLKGDESLENGDWQEAFAVLWTDEQMAFTERWRVLDLFDWKFDTAFQPMVGVATVLEEDFYPDAPFSPDRWFCPFRYGHVRPWSRMAVARQFVAVTGINPGNDEIELYTIHFAWGSSDKTWRRRRLPATTTADSNAEASCDRTSLQMRGDATLVFAGHRERRGKRSEGYWTQRVLPASGQERPSVAALGGEPRFSPRQGRFEHPWRFVRGAAFQALHQRFSHYGVLEPVDSRIQCYRIEVVQRSAGIDDALLESVVWIDRDGQFEIPHTFVSWKALGDAIRGLVSKDAAALAQACGAAQKQSDRASRYHREVPFRLRNVPGLGWVARFSDAQDDKTIAVNWQPTRQMTLSAHDDRARTVTLRGLRSLKGPRDPDDGTPLRRKLGITPPAVKRVELSVTRDDLGTIRHLDVWFDMAIGPGADVHPSFDDGDSAAARFRRWVASNVWRVCIGALHPQTLETVALFDFVREIDFHSTDNVRWTGGIDIKISHPWFGILDALLSEEGAETWGTSVWFVGATGLAAPPDETVWNA